MFGFLKDILGKGSHKPSTPAVPAAPAPAEELKPSAPPAKPASVPAGLAASGPVETVTLPLKPIVEKLPKSLQEKIAKAPASNATAPVPIRSIAEQLQKGSVRIPLAELVKLCPPDTFSNVSPGDAATMVEIPLGILLPKVNPGMLTRRSNQKQIEVPDDVAGLFGPHGEGTAQSQAARPEPSKAAPPAAPVAAPAPAPVPAPAPKPESKPEASAPLQISPAMREAMASAAATAKTAPSPKPPTPIAPPPASPPPPKPSAPPTPTIPVAAATGDILTVPLSEVSANWPVDVLKEIPDAASASLALPLGSIGEGVRLGKVNFAWKQLRACLRPAPLTGASAQDETVLELPLKVIAPRFLSVSKPVPKTQKKAVVADNIPDMFAGKAPAVSAPPPPPAAVPAPPTPAPAPPPPGPAKAPGSPAEFVQGAVKLPGVAGAIIALPEGLQVAAQLPPGLKAETVAAFLPQIFNRLGQCAREMNLGDLDGVTFSAGGVPWQLFKSGNVFFAAVGRKDGTLPAAQLAAMAAELAKQAK